MKRASLTRPILPRRFYTRSRPLQTAPDLSFEYLSSLAFAKNTTVLQSSRFLSLLSALERRAIMTRGLRNVCDRAGRSLFVAQWLKCNLRGPYAVRYTFFSKKQFLSKHEDSTSLSICILKRFSCNYFLIYVSIKKSAHWQLYFNIATPIATAVYSPKVFIKWIQLGTF